MLCLDVFNVLDLFWLCCVCIMRGEMTPLVETFNSLFQSIVLPSSSPSRRCRAVGVDRAGSSSLHRLVSPYGVGVISTFWKALTRLLAHRLLLARWRRDYDQLASYTYTKHVVVSSLIVRTNWFITKLLFYFQQTMMVEFRIDGCCLLSKNKERERKIRHLWFSNSHLYMHALLNFLPSHTLNSFLPPCISKKVTITIHFYLISNVIPPKSTGFYCVP